MSATPADGSQADTDAPAQAANTPGTNQPQAGQSDDLSPAQLRAELADARKEAAKFRTQLRGFEKGEADRRAAELSEVEKRDVRIRELEDHATQSQQRARQYALRDAVEQAVGVQQLALTAPLGDVLRLLDADAIEWDDQGAPKHVAALVKALVADRPYLVGRRGSVDGGAGGGQVAGNMNDLLRGMIRR